MPAFKTTLNNVFQGVKIDTTLLGSKFNGTLSLPAWEMPALHNKVQRTPPVVKPGAQAGGRQVHDQLALGRRHRRLRRRAPLGPRI